jgi:hypothetical protein
MMLPVFALGGFGAIWGVLRVSTHDEGITYSVWSADAHYRTSIVQIYGSGGCSQSESSVVLIERRKLIFNTGQFVPFCLDGPPSSISLYWQNEQTLAIECSRCNQNYAYADQNWGQLHFVYDLDRP